MGWVLMVGVIWVALAVIGAVIFGVFLRGADRRHWSQSELTVPDYFFQRFQPPVTTAGPTRTPDHLT
jgi:hypothetical protein